MMAKAKHIGGGVSLAVYQAAGEGSGRAGEYD
jgi:hypothetical protein